MFETLFNEALAYAGFEILLSLPRVLLVEADLNIDTIHR